MKSVDYLQVFTIALCACLLILSEKHIVNFFGILSDFFKPIFGSKDNLTIKLIMRFAWIPILGGFILVLASLGTLGGKIVFTLLILLMGWLLSNVLRQAILSLIEPFGVKNKLWSKFFGYFVFVHFLIAAIYLWG